MEAQDFIVPEEKDCDRDALPANLERIKSNVIKTADSANLTKTCLAFEFPVYGYLTELEIFAFGVYHMQRHLRQLDKIYQTV